MFFLLLSRETPKALSNRIVVCSTNENYCRDDDDDDNAGVILASQRRSFVVDDDALALQRHALQVLRTGPAQRNDGRLIVAHAVLALLAEIYLRERCVGDVC